MRNSKAIFPIVFPLFFAALLFSIPQHVNLSLRNQIGAFLANLGNLSFAKKKSGKFALSEKNWLKLDNWLKLNTKMMVLASCTSSALKNIIPSENKTEANEPLIGKVIFRQASSWNNSLWIDLGEDDNPDEGPKKISKNSPVLSGDSVVGVVDYVGKKTSLVRLITDSSLIPSVRIARSETHNYSLQYAISLLKELTESRKDTFEKEEEKAAFLFLLNKISEKFPKTDIQFLAKGELQGLKEPIFRGQNLLLKGVGFNYDFQDEHGPARDLRTGLHLAQREERVCEQNVALLKVGDLLVTSGLDGIFPEGLKVATIQEIFPLKEGAFSYELLAKPEAEDLNDLTLVFVLPPQGFNPEEAPNRLQKLLKEIPNS